MEMAGRAQADGRQAEGTGVNRISEAGHSLAPLAWLPFSLLHPF